MIEKELKKKQLLVEKDLKEKDMQALEKQKLLEWAEKAKERMKQEFEVTLQLNLQLVEEKRRNEQLAKDEDNYLIIADN